MTPGYIRIYTGPRPPTPESEPPGTLIYEFPFYPEKHSKMIENAEPIKGLDANLSALLDFITGRGRFKWAGGGAFYTHPGHNDEKNRLHDACVELERLGYIHRTLEEHGRFMWMAKSATR